MQLEEMTETSLRYYASTSWDDVFVVCIILFFGILLAFNLITLEDPIFSRIFGGLLILESLYIFISAGPSRLIIDRAAGKVIVLRTRAFGIYHRTKTANIADITGLKVKWRLGYKAPYRMDLIFIGKRKTKFKSSNIHLNPSKNSKLLVPRNSLEVGYAQTIADFLGVPVI